MSVMASTASVTLKPSSLCEARGGLDADAGGNANQYHLRDALLAQIRFEVGVRERAPGALGHQMIRRLLIQFGHEVRKAGGEVAGRTRTVPRGPGAPPATLTSTTGRPWRRNASIRPTERLHDLCGGMGGGQRDDALLQIDDDQCGLCVERGEGHDVFLEVTSR